MADQHDIQKFVDILHVFVEHVFEQENACPSCLAQAMISEGFHLAGQAGPGAVKLATETADRYANGDGGPVLSKH